jgi:exosortase
MPRKITEHHLWFLGLSILSFALFRLPLTTLLSVSFLDDRYTHVLVIPLISAFLVYFARKSIFVEPQYCLSWGVPLLLLGVMFFWIMQRSVSFSDQNDYLCCAVLSLGCVWVAAFVLSYGTKALCAARFPLSFLLLMVPMPTFLLDRTVSALQIGSADTTRVLFRLIGLPVDWLGLGFSIAGWHFEIAKECSGIHSTLILFVTGILAGHLFLRSIWGKVCFSVITVLVAVFKNAVRIVTIACLTIYVDQSFHDSWLHRKGGVVFAAFALAILAPSLLALQKAEPYLVRKPPISGSNEDAPAEERPDCVSRHNDTG